MFVVRRLQAVEWKAGVSIFMCFIHLQKAYGTVGRTLSFLIYVILINKNSEGKPPEYVW